MFSPGPFDWNEPHEDPHIPTLPEEINPTNPIVMQYPTIWIGHCRFFLSLTPKFPCLHVYEPLFHCTNTQGNYCWHVPSKGLPDLSRNTYKLVSSSELCGFYLVSHFDYWKLSIKKLNDHKGTRIKYVTITS